MTCRVRLRNPLTLHSSLPTSRPVRTAKNSGLIYQLKVRGAPNQSHECSDGGSSLDFVAGMGHKNCPLPQLPKLGWAVRKNGVLVYDLCLECEEELEVSGCLTLGMLDDLYDAKF